MKQIVLEKLDWAQLVEILSSNCKTSAGKVLCQEIKPILTEDQILSRWNLVEPMRDLINNGYAPPISELEDLSQVLLCIEKGQILTGEQLRDTYNMLILTKVLHKFCKDFGQKYSTLEHIRSQLYPLPNITAEISKTIGPDGELLDDASPKLTKIRKSKLSLRKNIEQKITELLHSQDIMKYLQDEFFTVRSERYVIPMKLDGHGRIKGSIYDTSDSGQTMFIEPVEITPLNEQLLELELAEKIEVLRIFRDLGEKLKKEHEILAVNYQKIIELDFLNAQGQLAASLNANRINLAKKPCINLIKAFHPLIRTPDGKNSAIPNNIVLTGDQTSLIISGPNAGGKTVVLKTVGMLQLMLKSGLLIPADTKSEFFLFKQIFLEMGDTQSLTANLSTFSGHIQGLKPIIQSSSENDLVLLDEIAAGTEPQAGSALAQAIVEDLANRGVTTVVTTHFDALKSLAIGQNRFRNGSMEYETKSHKPTYRLILDVPGQSYGIEVAKQMGLPNNIIDRAVTLRGSSANSLDEVLKELHNAREELRQKQQLLRTKELEAETAKTRWNQEREILKSTRSETKQKISQHYEDIIQELKDEYHQWVDKLKKKLRSLEMKNVSVTEDRNEFVGLRQGMEESIGKTINSLQQAKSSDSELSNRGTPATFELLSPGSKVYVASLDSTGSVAVAPSSKSSTIEVQVGLLNVKTDISDLYIPNKTRKPNKAKARQPAKAAKNNQKPEIPLTIKTTTNSVDLRGMDSDDATSKTDQFIDQALLRGEERIILIHGHGTNTLKRTLRDHLANHCPYNILSRPGEDQEGGDGVTIVSLSH